MMLPELSMSLLASDSRLCRRFHGRPFLTVLSPRQNLSGASNWQSHRKACFLDIDCTWVFASSFVRPQSRSSAGGQSSFGCVNSVCCRFAGVRLIPSAASACPTFGHWPCLCSMHPERCYPCRPYLVPGVGKSEESCLIQIFPTCSFPALCGITGISVRPIWALLLL